MTVNNIAAAMFGFKTKICYCRGKAMYSKRVDLMSPALGHLLLHLWPKVLPVEPIRATLPHLNTYMHTPVWPLCIGIAVS